ncbi:TetR/AcrR family transcriptional regulator [Salinifilum ghardaiensis]
MTSPAAERGSAVRQRLLRAAVELVPERGWSAVSTRVLAERAGVTPSVVHYHFPSLQDLLHQAVTALIRQVLDETAAQLDAARGPREVIRALFASVADYTGDDPASLVFVEVYLAATRDEDLRERVRGELDRIRQQVAAVLRAHEVPAPEETAAVALAALDGVLLHRGLGAGFGGAEQVLLRLVEPDAQEGARTCE